jgi:rhodanese-related sulfurtransferase
MPPAEDAPSRVPELSPLALCQRLGSGQGLTLLDVREPNERAFCSISVPSTASDLHIPLREIPTRLVEIQGALARGPLVVYCHHGVRSKAMAEWIAGQHPGEVFNLTGGIEAWSVAVDPRVPRYY